MGRFFAAVCAAAALALVLPAACSKKSSSASGVDGGADLAIVRCLYVDDAGVTHGCLGGGMGPGDRDDGGGAPLVGAPDASADLMNLPFGAECLNNGQCASNICYYYRVKGQFCTQLCATNADCPPSSLGCGGQYVCRVGN